MTSSSPAVATAPSTPEEARARFPILEDVAYLNAGTFGPVARPTWEAMAAVHEGWLRRGAGGAAAFEAIRERRRRVRAGLAALLGVEAAQVALTSSTTEACNIVVSGLDLQPGDEVVTTDNEHFGLLGPLGASPARVRVAPVLDRPAAEAAEAILAEVTPRTRLLAVSHVGWMNGHVLPVAELRRRSGLPVLVDGAQSAGAIPAEAAGVDFYTVSCQKWLCGPDHTGALFVREPDRLRVALPSFAAAADHRPDGRFTPTEGAGRFELSFHPDAAMAGLEAALSGRPAWAYERAAEMAGRCRELLGENLQVVSEPGQGTLVSFVAPGDPQECVSRLLAAGVVVRSLPGRPWIRVSCGYWTSEGDLSRLVGTLAG